VSYSSISICDADLNLLFCYYQVEVLMAIMTKENMSAFNETFHRLEYSLCGTWAYFTIVLVVGNGFGLGGAETFQADYAFISGPGGMPDSHYFA
jgi:hypothetical protein